MKVRDLMQRRVTSIDAEGTIGLAIQLMLWREVRHLPVLDEGRLVGLISERDLLRLQAAGEVGTDTRVGEVMVRPVEHIHPDAEVADAAADMATRNLGCMPVVDAGELVGILTRTDVLANVAQVPVPAPAEASASQATLRAHDLMTPDPISVHADQSLVDAAANMAARGIRHLCVVDGERRVIGMLSDRDLRSQIGDTFARATTPGSTPSERLSSLRVAHAMTEGARCALPETPLSDLVNIFLTEHIGAVPVLDEDDHLIGIVSYIDILRALAAGVV